MSLKDNLGNVYVMSGGVQNAPQNIPTQYSGRQKQYYEPETARFIHKFAKYASDFFVANVQGLNPDNFDEWSEQYIRMADLVVPSASTTKTIDDFKTVIFADESINYVPKGAKLVTMGSTWLVTNPSNISSAVGNTVAERCNAVWNHLDYYGNVLSEPIVVENDLARANTNNVQEFTLLTKGYYNVKAQLNKYTAELGQNSRIILGSKAYAITGYTDFLQEFTGDYGSVHICEFSINYEEPNKEIDDLANHVAGGLTFSWEIKITGPDEIGEGGSAQLAAESIRNGEQAASTGETPISYLWASSDDSIASVDENGLVSAKSAGECRITCTLAQNTDISAEAVFRVSQASSGGYIRFTKPAPSVLNAYSSAVIQADYYENGVKTGNPVTWDFSNAAGNAYAVLTDGNSATVTCYGYSAKPLIVTASYGNAEETVQITLLGA